MSDKPRVYQGVRVKTTVKELLQRHRAREANSKKVKTISQTCLDLQELCAATLPADARAFQRTNSFSFPDGSCSLQMQESPFHNIQQQFGDLPLPGSGYTGHHNNHSNNNNTNNNHTGDGGCSYSSAPLPPPPSLPLPWCHGLSSDADFYGHGMAPCSPPGSLKLCHPNMDANSYSPQDSFSSSSSSCYDSPTRLCESSSYHHQPHHHGSLASVDSHYNHYQHCSLQDCYCLPHCWPTATAQQESFSSGPELYAPYNNNPCTDYSYTCATEENTFRRDLQMSSEMCYNVL